MIFQVQNIKPLSKKLKIVKKLTVRRGERGLSGQAVIELASVCHRFRAAVFCCPIPIRLPLSDQQLHLMRSYKIPVISLCNVQPSMYVSDQLSHLNLQRLEEAQLGCKIV